MTRNVTIGVNMFFFFFTSNERICEVQLNTGRDSDKTSLKSSIYDTICGVCRKELYRNN